MASLLARARKSLIGGTLPAGRIVHRRDTALHLSDELAHAYKSVSYSQFVTDFINDEGTGGINYSEQQLQGAYRSSVYLFAGLRLVANMMSTLGQAIRAEGKDDHGKWARMPSDEPLNVLFDEQGPALLRNMYLFNGIFGSVLVYKRKTNRALYAERQGKPIWKWGDGAIAGMHVIPNVGWELDEQGYNGPIRGFHVYSIDDYLRNKPYLHRHECIYYHDFDPEQRNKGVSIGSLAINDAVSNAAVARWAAHYFMSGAMPMLLVSSADDDPNMTTEADLLRRKNWIERQWQGLWSKFSLRAVFTERKLDVVQVGIKAEDVNAPELDRAALARICSVIGITPDLIVPPEGGSDNARHKYLIKQAWQSTVMPTGEQFLAAIERDFGLSRTNRRLVIAEEEIPALEADRGDVATTESDIFAKGLQTFGEARSRLQLRPTDFDDWLWLNNTLVSPAALKRSDETLDDKMAQRVDQWWNDDLMMRSEARKMLALESPPDMKDGFKSEVVANAAGGIMPGFNPNDPGGGGGSGGKVPKNDPGGGGTGGEGSSGGSASPKPPPPENPPPEEPTPPKEVAAKPKDDGKKDVEGEVAEGETPKPPLVPKDIVLRETNTGTVVLPPGAVVNDAALEERLPTPAYIYLELAHDLMVGQIQRTLQHQFGDLVKWQMPETYHLSLAYIPDATDAQLEAVRKLLPAYYNRLQFHAESLTCFDAGNDGTPVVILVERDNGLDAVQGAVRAALGSQLVALGDFSKGENYTPHITVGYAPPELIIPDYDLGFVVEPTSLCICRDNYDVIHRVRVIPDPSVLLGVDVDNSGNEPLFDSVGDMDAALTEIYALRQRWISALNRGQLDALPERVRALVQQCLKNADFETVIAAACRAASLGELDDQAVLEDNPIEKYMKPKAKQITPEQELEAWKKSALLHPTKALTRFAVKTLPLAVEEQVKEGLKEAHDREAVLDVFRKARAVIREMHPRHTDGDHLKEWADHINSLEDAELKSVLDFDDD